MANDAYLAKLRDPRWQKKRLEILSRDEWCCQMCGDSTQTLHVHHHYYERGHEPWEYPNEALVTLCEDCHEDESAYRAETERTVILTLRRAGFLNGALVSLAEAFHALKLEPCPLPAGCATLGADQLASALQWLMTQEGFETGLVRAYLDFYRASQPKTPNKHIQLAEEIPG